jgi:hypothetical protein
VQWNNSVASWDVPAPPHQAGDLLIATADHYALGGAAVSASGWTPLYIATVDASKMKMAVFYRFATSFNSTYNFTMSSNPVSIIMASYRHAGTPVLPNFNNLYSGNTLTAPSITPTTSGRLVSLFMANTGNAGAITWTDPSGTTRKGAVGASGSTYYDAQLYCEEIVTAGATGSRSAGYSSSLGSAYTPQASSAGLFFIPDAP